jgi:GNAT superfamily N-acetyltransferase
VLGDDGAPLAVGTVIPEEPGWRVRGMATAPEARGQGLGALVLAALIDHARGQDADLVWCAARPRAVALYERAGFVPAGEEYEVPDLGPHRRMMLRLG